MCSQISRVCSCPAVSFQGPATNRSPATVSRTYRSRKPAARSARMRSRSRSRYWVISCWPVRRVARVPSTSKQRMNADTLERKISLLVEGDAVGATGGQIARTLRGEDLPPTAAPSIRAGQVDRGADEVVPLADRRAGVQADSDLQRRFAWQAESRDSLRPASAESPRRRRRRRAASDETTKNASPIVFHLGAAMARAALADQLVMRALEALEPKHGPARPRSAPISA